MEYKFIDIDDNSFEVNGTLTPSIPRGSFSRSSENYSFEQKIIERSFLPGAAQVGNARLESRGLSFNQNFAFSTDSDYDDFLNEFILWAEKTVVVKDITNDRETKVAVLDLSVDYDKGSIKRSGEISIKFSMLDSFWTDSTATILNESLSIGINNIAITNDGFLLTYPLLTFDVPNPAASLDIFIDETKEGLQLIDPTLGNPTLEDLIIDCVSGSLTIAGFDRTQNITDRTGYFPFPIGSSTLVIDIPVAADVTIKFFKRYYS